MKALFIVALINVKLLGSFGRGLRLSDTHFLTNDPTVIHPLLSSNFERIAGLLETEAIRNAPGVIYSITEYNAATFKDEHAQRFVGQQLGFIQNFLITLWLVKDNAVNVELGFLERPYQAAFVSSVSSNYRDTYFSDASGKFPMCEFTDVELRVARDIFVKQFAKNVVELEQTGRTVPPDFDRVERVLYFSQRARASSDLGMKVATYVTCFESLFCTESSELAHKLAERLAFFCGDTPNSMFEIFKTAKTAYTIRSKTVHGDKLSARLAEQARPVSLECDGLLRKTLNKILTTPGMHEQFVASPEQLEDYLTRLVFGFGA